MKKLLILGLATLSSAPAFAGWYVVGFHSCQFSSGPGLFWYTPCRVEGEFYSGGCDNAYMDLEKNDCCAGTGGVKTIFRRTSCTPR